MAQVTPENLIEYTKWNHVALVKHSNVVKLYVNGLAIGSYNHSGQVGYNASVTTICRIGGGGTGAVNVTARFCVSIKELQNIQIPLLVLRLTHQ